MCSILSDISLGKAVWMEFKLKGMGISLPPMMATTLCMYVLNPENLLRNSHTSLSEV